MTPPVVAPIHHCRYDLSGAGASPLRYWTTVACHDSHDPVEVTLVQVRGLDQPHCAKHLGTASSADRMLAGISFAAFACCSMACVLLSMSGSTCQGSVALASEYHSICKCACLLTLVLVV